MESNFQSKKKELFIILQNYDTNKIELSQKVEEFVSNLIQDKWKRKDVYDLVYDIINDLSISISEVGQDILLDVETSLSGYCATNYIYRFPGDPESSIELQNYARSSLWKNKK